MAELTIFILVGILTGVIVGLSGGSGVMVVVPLLTLLQSFSVYTAIGTSLLVDVITSIFTTYTYYTYGNVDLKDSKLIITGALLGAIIGSILALSLPEIGVGTFFGVILILMGISTWRRGIRNARGDDKPKFLDKLIQTKYRSIVIFALGLYAGVSAGLAGAGGGGTIFVILVFILNYPISKAVGTSTFIMIITALTASLNYLTSGYVNLVATAIIGIVATICSVITARYANRIDEARAGKLIGYLFLILGCFMIILQLQN